MDLKASATPRVRGVFQMACSHCCAICPLVNSDILFMLWENFLSETQGDITGIWSNYAATLCPRLRSYVLNISLLRKLAEDTCKDVKLWTSWSEGGDIVDMDFPLDEGDYTDGPAIAENH